MAKRVCIVGAGIAGLVTLKELTRVDGDKFNLTLFERTSGVGGLWQYAEVSGQIGGPGPLYRSLRTNTPKQTWNFRDFPLPHDTPTWLTPQHVADYLRAYAEEFKLKQFIKFDTSVTDVKVRQDDCGADHWTVTVQSPAKDEPEEFEFDNVIICTGLHTKPHIPPILGIDTFKGSVIHSSQYRVPEVYKDKTVLFIGALTSMSEICNDIGLTASQICVSQRRPSPMVLLPANVSLHSEIHSIQEDSVIFCHGAERKIDAIIFCTGFDVSHFLKIMDDSCELEMKNYFLPLYKGIVHPKHPTLMFHGTFDANAAVPLFECMAMFIASTLSGDCALPSEADMLEVIEKDFAEYAQTHKLSHFHAIGNRQRKYANELCHLGNYSYPQFPFVLFDHIFQRAFVDMAFPEYRKESYTKTSDTTFEVQIEESEPKESNV